MEIRRIILIMAILVLALTACQQDDLDIAPPEAVVIAAEIALSERTGVPEEEFTLVEVEDFVWPDACLGLAEEGEMCAQVITDGWRFIFEVEGQEYEVRSDETGGNIRIQEYNPDM